AQTVSVAPGTSRLRVFVPDLAAPATLEVALSDVASGNQLAQWKGVWQPQRKWKVFVVKSSHEDIGYENYIFKKQHDIANFIDLAHDQSKSHVNVTNVESKSDSNFHYTMETLLFQRNYIEERGER